MAAMRARLFATANDFALTLLRLVLGWVFLLHGGQLMLGWFGGHGFSGTMAFFESMGIPAPFAALAIIAQFFGGLGLLLGLLTRIAAFGIVVTMLVAVVKVHLAVGFFMNWAGTQKGEGYEFHLLAISMGLVLLWRGAGALSIDRVIGNKT
jgi:putative oxidoreductase